LLIPPRNWRRLVHKRFMDTIALLRAVNVGGTGKLPMAELKAMAEELGFANARTYIASGNLLFDAAGLSEAGVKARLEKRLAQFAGKAVGVLVRSAAEIARVVADNPFASEPGNRVVAIFLDGAPSKSALTDHKGLADERIALGRREIYVHYPRGQGTSRLIIPAAKAGTARNMNTVMKLAELAGN
jgi:uncharacterized protein (DUF1697 family)